MKVLCKKCYGRNHGCLTESVAGRDSTAEPSDPGSIYQITITHAIIIIGHRTFIISTIIDIIIVIIGIIIKTQMVGS